MAATLGLLRILADLGGLAIVGFGFAWGGQAVLHALKRREQRLNDEDQWAREAREKFTHRGGEQ